MSKGSYARVSLRMHVNILISRFARCKIDIINFVKIEIKCQVTYFIFLLKRFN